MAPKSRESKKKPTDRVPSTESVSSLDSDWCMVSDPEEAVKAQKSTSTSSSSSNSLLERGPKGKPSAAPFNYRQELNPTNEAIQSSKLSTNSDNSRSFDNLHSMLSDLHFMEPETFRKPAPRQSKVPTKKNNPSEEYFNAQQAPELPRRADIAGSTKGLQNSSVQGSQGPQLSFAAAERDHPQPAVTKVSSGPHNVSVPFEPSTSTHLHTTIAEIVDEVRFARYNLACAIATFSNADKIADPVSAAHFIYFMVSFYTRNIQDYEAFAVGFAKRSMGSRPDALQLHNLASKYRVKHNIPPFTIPTPKDAREHETWPALEEFAVYQAPKLVDKNRIKSAKKLSPAQEEAMGRVFKFFEGLGFDEAQAQKIMSEILKA